MLSLLPSGQPVASPPEPASNPTTTEEKATTAATTPEATGALEQHCVHVRNSQNFPSIFATVGNSDC